MSDIFADRLIDAIGSKSSPICVGIDPVYEQLPDAIAGPVADRDSNDTEAAIDAIFAFTTGVLRAVAPHVPVVKFQSAYFERYLWEGVEAYYSLIQEAKDLGSSCHWRCKTRRHRVNQCRVCRRSFDRSPGR